MGAVMTGCAKESEEEANVTITPADETDDIAKSDEPMAPPSFDDVDLSKIVTLGKYKGMELEKVISATTTEAIEAQVTSDLINAPVEDEDGVVDNGDTANIDFEGKLDGVPFEGGAGQGHNLEIGSGGFIPGFEEALIGAKKGDTLDIDVTFPNDYPQSKELEGKPAVFTVTINDITKILEEPTDEWVTANTDYKTVDEYKKAIEDDITEYNNEVADREIGNTAFTKLVEESEIIEYPEDALAYGGEVYKQSAQEYADASGMTLEEFLSAQGMTTEQFEEETKKIAEDVAKQMLVMNAVVQAEGFKEGNAKYDELLAEIEEESETPKEQLYEQYGEENIKQSIRMKYVKDVIVENAKITEVEAPAEPEVELPEGHSADDGHDH